MTSGDGPAPIDSSTYTEEYFLTAVEGHEQFRETGGRALSPRLARALALAQPGPGQRLLDIGCGRGEVVRQSAGRGACAVGIDYAAAATKLARTAPGGAEGRWAVVRMDATQLAFPSEVFDVALMLDFVEHVYQADLERSFREAHRVLKPGGRLIIHTSPNRLFEDVVYRWYVRNVHRLALAAGRRLRLTKSFFNPWVLPTEPTPPRNTFERQLHVNPQSAGSLRSALRRAGFRVCRVDFWELPSKPFFPAHMPWHNRMLGVLDAVRYLRPASRWPPLNRLFSNHIWVLAVRQ